MKEFFKIIVYLVLVMLLLQSVNARQYKTDQDLRQNKINSYALENNELMVYIEMNPNYSKTEFFNFLDSKGVDYSNQMIGNFIVAKIPLTEINNVANSDRVLYIEQINSPPKSHLYNIRPSVHYTPNVFDLLGSGVIVGEWDGGEIDSSHTDLSNKVSVVDHTTLNDHATHVAGIIMGNGTLSQGLFRGFAPNITMYSYDYFTGFFSTIVLEVASAVNDYNISLSHNSWGDSIEEHCERLGRYPIIDEIYDNMIRGESIPKPLIAIFSVGNERGYNYCNQQSYPYNTTTPPATTKNVISVGAVNVLSKSMTTFSSWGPTDDGRIKPEIVAPGCYQQIRGGIFSTIPNATIDLFNNLNGEPNPDGIDDYAYPYDEQCGTSMAAPVVTGIAALMLEQFRLNYSRDPLPSTIKAILIHTAEDIKNGEFGGPIDPRDGPGYESGYGLVNAQRAIEQIRNKSLTENSLYTNDTNKTYYTKIKTGADELKITLVWDDLPRDASSSGKQLKNDLDLIVIAPNGSQVYPWTLNASNPSQAATRNYQDHLNNVEQVFTSKGGTNTNRNWTIMVYAYNLTSAQNFSLIVDNFDDPNPPSSPTVWASPKKVGKNISVFWLEAKDQETGIAEYQYQLDNTTNASYVSVGQSTRFSITNTSQGKHTVFVRALDYFGNPSLPGNATFVFDSIAPTQANISANFITPVSVTINVDTTENATAHIEYGTTTSYGSVSGAEEFRQYQSVTLISLSANTLYHYRVHSTDEAGNNISTADNTFTTNNSSNIVQGFSGSLLPFVTASPVVNVTFNRPGQWDLSWDINGKNATLSIYDPQGALFASKTAPPGTARFYLDNGMLGTYTFQVTYTPALQTQL